MQLKRLLDVLERYLVLHPEEGEKVDHVRQFVRANPACFAAFSPVRRS